MYTGSNIAFPPFLLAISLLREIIKRYSSLVNKHVIIFGYLQVHLCIQLIMA